MKFCTLRNVIAFILVFGFMPGCASLGLVTPATFGERAAFAYGAATGARKAALAALTANTINSDDAAHVQGLADKVREGVDAARRLNVIGSSATALDRLILAEGVLREVQTYLTKRGIKTP